MEIKFGLILNDVGLAFTVTSASLLGVGTDATYFTSDEGVTIKTGMGSSNVGKYKINYK